MGSIFKYASGAPSTRSSKLLSVCRQWHNVALSLPSLWRHIDLSKPLLALKYLERCNSSQPPFVAFLWTGKVCIGSSELEDFERAFMSVMAESERIYSFFLRSPGLGTGYAFEQMYQDRLGPLLQDSPPCFSSLRALDVNLECCPSYFDDRRHKCNHCPNIEPGDQETCVDGLFGRAINVSKLHLRLCCFTTLALMQRQPTVLDLRFPFNFEDLRYNMPYLAPHLEVLDVPIYTPLGWTMPESQQVIDCPRMRKIGLQGSVVVLSEFLSVLKLPSKAQITMTSFEHENDDHDHASTLSVLARCVDECICDSAFPTYTYRAALGEVSEDMAFIRFSKNQSSGFFSIHVAPEHIDFEDLSIEMDHTARSRIESLRVFGSCESIIGLGLNFDSPNGWYAVAQAYEHISHLFVSSYAALGLVHTLATEVGRPLFPNLSTLDVLIPNEYTEDATAARVVGHEVLPLTVVAASATHPKLRMLGLVASPGGANLEELFRDVEDALKSQPLLCLEREHELVVEMKPATCMVYMI
jgi:hypothetical protein